MAYVTPASRLYLCTGVPLAKDYKDTIYFSSASSQLSYFVSMAKVSASDYSYIRKERVIRVNYNADAILDCNYMVFQNSAFGSKWFYCFIDDITYINNITAEIRFTVDAIQTWFFEMTLHPCYVERETSETDEIGDNIVPEGLETGDYHFSNLGSPDEFNTSWRYIAASSFDTDLNNATGGLYGGVYSGLCYNIFTSYSDLNDFLTEVTEGAKSDGIVNIFMLPAAFCVGVSATSPYTFELDYSKAYSDIDGYTPKNNKLFTYPYNFLYVTNNEGSSISYHYEDFSTSSCGFQFSAAMCSTPEAVCIPLMHKNVAVDYNSKITVANFPQCSYAIDTYKAYVAQNANSISTAYATATVSGVASAASSLASGNVLGAFSSGLSLASTVASMNASLEDKALQPPSVSNNSSSYNMVTLGNKGFQFMQAYCRAEFAEIIDDYFTVFGYACHKVKVPNISSRPYWNYTKTVGCNITGSIPANDMLQIKNAFDRGITFWKSGANVGNYELDNSPS